VTLSIRPATAADAATIRRLIHELAAFERAPEAVENTPENLAGQLEADPPPFGCLVAERDGEVVGFALHFFNYSTWTGRQGLYVEDLYVTPEARGAGAGKALFLALAGIARERGCGRMEWSVLDWNRGAIDFYRSFGAKPMDEWTTFRLDRAALEKLAGR
jgi:GNAT superfamily N-acetyltransferase